VKDFYTKVVATFATAGSPFPRAEKTEFSITTASILGTKENRGIPCHAHGLPVERK
jgi:hypothetical protein